MYKNKEELLEDIKDYSKVFDIKSKKSISNINYEKLYSLVSKDSELLMIDDKNILLDFILKKYIEK